MSARYAEIENSVVVNVFIADEFFVSEHKPNAILAPDFVGVGDAYIENQFHKVTGEAAQIELETE